ncbi:unnamed protein product [Ostreobium quekettii]|uniref:Protein kinase domain-containing protein n=1 Tax=Ostreobium quekettii TaxID=121088 RepID=A0A8S1JGX4_9CHLO|nr:unnamed protein product [Ostreobium quekettii]
MSILGGMMPVLEIVGLVRELVDLGIAVKSSADAVKTNKENKKLLLEQIRTLEPMLIDISCQCQSEENKYKASMPSAAYNSEADALLRHDRLRAEKGVINALFGIRVQLHRGKDLLDRLGKKKFALFTFLQATDIKEEFKEVRADLGSAMQILQVAQTVLLGRSMDCRAAELLDAILRGKTELMGKVSEVLTTLNSRELLEGTTDEAHRSKNGGSGAEESLCLRYNRCMLGFLHRQMAQIDSISPQQMLRASAEADAQEWKSSSKKMRRAMDIGKILIHRHARPFNLQTFYKIAEVKNVVKVICGTLREFAGRWDFPIEIEDGPPEIDVLEDKAALGRCLAYVLKNEPCPFDEVDARFRDEWANIKAQHEGILRVLNISISDAEVVLERRICGSVFKARWRDVQDVAVKKLVRDGDPNQLDLEDFAEFFTEVAAMASMASPYVVSFIAATYSGMLVMELGAGDLIDWCQRRGPAGLPLKLMLLRQAAEGLKDVHEQRFVHRDVNSRNFVVFEGDRTPPRVKIVGFGLAIVKTETGTRTLRQRMGSSPAWVAPEIFDGRPHSFESDMYSFGVVMYEVVGGGFPYGRRTAPADVLAKKRGGEPPCSLPDGLPEGLVEVMERCCAIEPGERPTGMREVCGRLAALCRQLPCELEGGRGGASSPASSASCATRFGL